MRTPRFLVGLWDEKDAERGVLLGLIVGTIVAALFTTSDYIALNFDYIRGQNPYGVLWYWLNGQFWTDFPYRMYTMFLVLGEELIMWAYLIHGPGKKWGLSKFLFYAGWFQEIIWMRGSVFQNATVTLFAPLGQLIPWLIIPFMLLQKLPIGWSWNGSDAHWWCAFMGNNGFTSGDTIAFPNGQQLISCPGGWLRWNPAYSWFWSYAMIMFWIIVPTLFWLKPRWKVWKESRRNDDGEIEGHVLLRPICWKKGHNTYILGRKFRGQIKWVCARCGWIWGKNDECNHKGTIIESPEGILACTKCGKGDLY